MSLKGALRSTWPWATDADQTIALEGPFLEASIDSRKVAVFRERDSQRYWVHERDSDGEYRRAPLGTSVISDLPRLIHGLCPVQAASVELNADDGTPIHQIEESGIWIASAETLAAIRVRYRDHSGEIIHEEVFHGDPAAAAGLGPKLVGVDVDAVQASVHRARNGSLVMCVRYGSDFELRTVDDLNGHGVVPKIPRFFFGELGAGESLEALAEDKQHVHTEVASDVWIAHTMSPAGISFRTASGGSATRTWKVPRLSRSAKSSTTRGWLRRWSRSRRFRRVHAPDE